MIDDALKAAPRLAKVAGRLARADYIERKNSTIVGVFCSVCGTQISGMVADRDFEIKREQGGRTIIQERLMLAPNASYREVSFAMDDGSRHITNVCSECADKLINDSELREAVYSSDLAVWEDEGVVHETCYKRAPVRVLQIAPNVA